MPKFQVDVFLHDVDDLRSAWVALAGNGLHPKLPAVELEVGSRVGPIRVLLDAETEELAHHRIREALAVAAPRGFDVASTS